MYFLLQGDTYLLEDLVDVDLKGLNLGLALLLATGLGCLGNLLSGLLFSLGSHFEQASYSN